MSIAIVVKKILQNDVAKCNSLMIHHTYVGPVIITNHNQPRHFVFILCNYFFVIKVVLRLIYWTLILFYFIPLLG